ncbi:MAG: Hpt domain-containing protein [Halothiobacillaceae bacterium]
MTPREELMDAIALDWIREGVDEQIERLRLALEPLTGESAAPEHAEDAARVLEQLGGVFAMTDLHVARVLTREMMLGCQHMVDRDVFSAEVVSALVRGAWQLGPLMDHLQAGDAVQAIDLASVVNAIRAARGVEAMDAEALRAQHALLRLAGMVPLASPRGDQQPDLSALRGRYEQALLGLLRGQPDGTEVLAGIFSELVGSAQTRMESLSWRLLFELIRAFPEPTAREKMLLGRVNRVLRAAVDQGRGAGYVDQLDALARGVLFHLVEQLPESEHLFGLPVAELRAAQAGGRDQAQFVGLERAAVEQAASELESEYAAIEDALDMFVRGNRSDLDPLTTLMPRLLVAHRTLNFLGAGEQSDDLPALASRLESAIAGEATLDDAYLMQLAGAVMQGQVALNRLTASALHGTRSAPLMVDLALFGAIEALMEAATDAFLSAKSEVDNLLVGSRAALDKAEAALESVEGALSVSGMNAVQPLLAGLRRWIQAELAERPESRDPETLTALATLFAAVEYYFRNLRTYRRELTRFLQVGLDAQQALDAALGEAQPAERKSVAEPAEQAIEPSAALPAASVEPGPQEEAPESAEPEEAQTAVAPSERPVEPPSPVTVPMDEAPAAASEPPRAAEPEPAPEPEQEPEPGGESVESIPAPEMPDLSDLAIEAPEPAPQPSREPNVQAEPEEPPPTFAPVATGAGRVELPPLLSAPALAEPDRPLTDFMGFETEFDVDTHHPPDESEREMRLVFAEEIGELIDALESNARGWHADRTDRHKLSELRRGFHTVKGSGRIVGLEAIGAWAWAQENLLNGVLDGVVEPCVTLREHVVDAVDRLRRALRVLEQGFEPGPGYWRSSRHRADRLAGGEEVLPDDKPAPDPAAQVEALVIPRLELPEETETAEPAEGAADVLPEAEETAEAAPPVIADPVLREIFDKEIGGYIQALRERINHARSVGVSLVPDEALARLTHTLLGSARTAGVSEISQLARAVEDVMLACREAGSRLHQEPLTVFSEAVDRIEQLRRWAIGELPEPVPTHDLIERLLALRASFAGAGVPGMQAPKAAQTEAPGVEPLKVEPAEPAVVPSASSETVKPELSPGAQPAAEPADESERPDDLPAEQDPEILEIFLEEADELVEAADEQLQAWHAQPDAADPIRLLHRNLHTLKGGARMAGLMNIAEITHLLEDRLDRARDRGVDNPRALVALVQRTYDTLGTLIDRVRNMQPVPAQHELLALLSRDELPDSEALTGAAATPEVTDAAPAAAPTPQETAQPAGLEGAAPAETAPEEAMSFGTAETDEKAAEPAPAQLVDQPEATPAVERAAPREQLRVPSERIDELVAEAGESLLLQARIDRQMHGFERQLGELNQTVSRLRGQLRRLEIETESSMRHQLHREGVEAGAHFDPLEFDRFTRVQELSRSLMEALGDIDEIEDVLREQADQARTLLVQQGRLGRTQQDQLIALRLVRFGDLAGRLQRLVRQVAAELGRRAMLSVEGGDVRLDRVTLMALQAPLEHMIRNAIAHGIEPPAARQQAGKPAEGQLRIHLESQGGNILMTVSDDGRGLDLEAIRRKARARGLIEGDREISDEEARTLIFDPGFSTAETVSQVAGRGVGMDVVATAVRQLGGYIEVDSSPGAGTRIEVTLPLTQALTRGVLLGVGEQRYAIPDKGILSVVRVSGRALADAYASEQPALSQDGQSYPLYYLGDLLWGDGPPRALGVDMRPVLLMRLGERRLAVQVDRQYGVIQLFVKALGPRLDQVPGLMGATIDEDGEVTPVLDLVGLYRHRRAGGQAEAGPRGREDRPLVLVVDDSVTIRKVTARILERRNIETAVARDGVEALGMLRARRPDLVLSDIEMPRMDGFELLGAIRNDAQIRDLPVIFITSRTAAKHRERAESLGVSGYLGKPYTETELLAAMAQWLPGLCAEDESP